MKAVVIGIAGATGSGKTTLCGLLEQLLKQKNFSHKTFHQDEFYKTSSSMLSEAEVFANSVNWETPDKIDFDSLIGNLETAKSSNVDYILVEGFLLLADQRLIDYMDHIVFMHVDKNVAKQRRFHREPSSDEQHKNNFNTYFETFIWPSYHLYTFTEGEKVRNQSNRNLLWLDGCLQKEELLEQMSCNSCNKCSCSRVEKDKFSLPFAKTYWLSDDNQYLITTEPSLVDIEKLHQYLSTDSYWAMEIPMDYLKRGVYNSLPFSILAKVDANTKEDGTRKFVSIKPDNVPADLKSTVQKSKFEFVGFGRIVTDLCGFGYIEDVFIDRVHRGKGLGKFLIACMLKHEDCQYFRRWALGTKDGHELYRKFGFTKPSDRVMEIFVDSSTQYRKWNQNKAKL